MLRFPISLGVCASILGLPFILSSVGCSTSATKESHNSAAATTSPKTGDGCCSMQTSQSQVAPSGNEADPDIIAELAKLPSEDRALAEKQKICPVTDALLGSMGTPVKVTVKGRTVFLCCEGCEEDINKNADKYLAKLAQARAK